MYATVLSRLRMAMAGLLLPHGRAGAAASVNLCAITPAEIMSMPTKLSNAAYGYKPTAGWLMNAATLEYIYALLGTSGNRVFPKKFDDEGYPLLMEQRVYLSPNFESIGASKKVAAFGDLSRFWIRQVGDSFTVYKFTEAYMANHQWGYQAVLRADGQIVSADGGSTDFPIVTMQMHS